MKKVIKWAVWIPVALYVIGFWVEVVKGIVRYFVSPMVIGGRF